MVIDHRFIWLHFGKAGGTSIRFILSSLFPSAIIIPDNTPNKHSGLSEMSRFGISIPDNIPFVACFRRLPLWAESHVLHQYGDGTSWKNILDAVNGKLHLHVNSPARKVGMFERVETYDDLLEYYFQNGLVNPVRLDKAYEDFGVFFSNYKINYDKILAESLFLDTRMNRRNVSANNIFSRGMMQDMYDACPKWTQMVLELYGDLLI